MILNQLFAFLPGPIEDPVAIFFGYDGGIVNRPHRL